MLKNRKGTLQLLLLLHLFAWSGAEGQQPAPKPVQQPPSVRPQAAAKEPVVAQALGQSSPQTLLPGQQTAQPPAQAAGQTGQQKDPRAVLVWSVVLDKDAPAILPAEAGFAGTRSAAIAGNRVVALFETASEFSHGGRPASTFRLVSLDLKTGEVKNQKEIQAQSFPYLFATGDDHLILGHTSLTRLNPDLSESGEKFEEAGSGRTLSISPDGSVLAHWSGEETMLLDAHTLSFGGVRIAGPEAAAASRRTVLSDDARWASQFPQDLTFITLSDEHTSRLLYRGPCGGRPAFLSEDKILFIGCRKVIMTDATGEVLKELPLGAAYGSLAGVSRDGSRFAVESSDYSIGDPSYKPDELFTIYNAETYETVATVAPETLSQHRSWSAFSPDGKLFLCGSPEKLILYRIP